MFAKVFRERGLGRGVNRSCLVKVCRKGYRKVFRKVSREVFMMSLRMVFGEEVLQGYLVDQFEERQQ